MSKPSLPTLLVVYFCLVALWLITFAVSEVPLGRPWNFLIALGIAGLKMILIMLFFMHLYYSKPLTRLVACAGFFWLAILIGLAFADFYTRGWPLV
jgi:cytochrome c oxidase subunit IV